MRDHREHDAEIIVALFPETFERLNLETELIRTLDVTPDSTPAEHGVVFMGFVLLPLHIPEFIIRGIERPHPHRLAVERIENNLDAIVEFPDKILLPIVGNEPARCLIEPDDQVFDTD